MTRYTGEIKGQKVIDICLIKCCCSVGKGGYDIWSCIVMLEDETEVEGSVWYHAGTGEILNGSFEEA